MISWSAIGSLFRRATAIQWAPTLTAHDPNPPLNLEDPSGGGGDITGTSANTQRAQTSAASGSLTIAGTGAGTQRAQTSSASGTLRTSGTAAGSQRAQTSAATSTIRVSGTGSGTQTPQTSAATATISVTGTGAGTQRAQTSTASGTIGSSAITGTSVNVQTPATSAATGTVQVITPEGGGMLPVPRRKKSKPVIIRLPKARREAITGTSENHQRAARSVGTGSITIRGNGASVIDAAPARSTATGWVENEEDLLVLLALSE